MTGWRNAKYDADLGRCREIADDFILAAEWTDVTREERLELVRMLKRYPLESIEVAMLPSGLTQEDWIL